MGLIYLNDLGISGILRQGQLRSPQVKNKKWIKMCFYQGEWRIYKRKTCNYIILLWTIYTRKKVLVGPRPNSNRIAIHSASLVFLTHSFWTGRSKFLVHIYQYINILYSFMLISDIKWSRVAKDDEWLALRIRKLDLAVPELRCCIPFMLTIYFIV